MPRSEVDDSWRHSSFGGEVSAPEAEEAKASTTTLDVSESDSGGCGRC